MGFVRPSRRFGGHFDWNLWFPSGFRILPPHFQRNPKGKSHGKKDFDMEIPWKNGCFASRSTWPEGDQAFSRTMLLVAELLVFLGHSISCFICVFQPIFKQKNSQFLAASSRYLNFYLRHTVRILRILRISDWNLHLWKGDFMRSLESCWDMEIDFRLQLILMCLKMGVRPAK